MKVEVELVGGPFDGEIKTIHETDDRVVYSLQMNNAEVGDKRFYWYDREDKDKFVLRHDG